jgi:glutamate-1-semialdehyde aminotransferase/3-oxoacyl-(acyl-carrier-protein) synthase/acyl-CoA synthetase (AMP-forming)/AMP-acid ligase II/acyl carrier protein
MSTDANVLTPMQKAYSAIQLLRKELDQANKQLQEPIAIVGMSCRAPGASNPDELWKLVRSGGDAITDIPLQRWNAAQYYDARPGTPGKSYTLRGGFVKDVDKFDAEFFVISAREAEAMDPQQRLLLEVAWEALESAGIAPSSLAGTAAGVFIGVTSSDYGLLQAAPNRVNEVSPYFNTGTPLNACAGRISYVFGLQGPSVAIDTACSSSLTAIHLACNALRAKDCDVALTGGVNLTLAPLLNVTLSVAGMLSADGQCKTFSEDANGYVRGEGCGIVVLKRLSDALSAGDNILGIIRATGINQDGASSGFTVPNGLAQQRLIRDTLAKAGIAARDIDYVEAHGTGTPLGDPIEAQSLGNVIGKAIDRNRPLLVGSLKSNIGHLESAAGVMGLIKLVKALEHQELPPTLHIEKPSSRIPWAELNLSPVRELQVWDSHDKVRYAGLSAFGASGSNAHLILEEAPEKETSVVVDGDERVVVLALSAKNKNALLEIIDAYGKVIESADASLDEICLNANRHRDHFKTRVAFVAKNKKAMKVLLADFVHGRTAAGLYSSLPALKKIPRVAFVFSGQGSIYAGMAKDLYHQQSSFKNALDHCINIVDQYLDVPLLPLIFSPESIENVSLAGKAQYAQPALFCIQYALCQMWISFGVKPCAVVGHSLGEYAAACIAGVLTVDNALRLVCERGRLTDTLENPGSMVVAFTTKEKIDSLIRTHSTVVSIAVNNATENVVLSGDAAALDLIIKQCKELGIAVYPLAVTHAFHSPLIDPILDEFESFAKSLSYAAPNLPFFSCLTGKILSTAERIDAAYWRRHYREPVQFSDTIESLKSAKPELILEIGPTPILSNIGKSQIEVLDWLPSLQQHKADDFVFSSTLAKFYSLGISITWNQVDFNSVRSALKLPTYPFQRQRYWISSNDANSMNQSTTSQVPPVSAVEAQYQTILDRLLGLFSELFRVPAAEIDVNAPFLEMGADSLILLSGARVIEDNFGVKIEIRQFFEDISSLSAIAHYLNSLQKMPMQQEPAPMANGSSGQEVMPVVTAPVQSAPVAPSVAMPAITPIVMPAVIHTPQNYENGSALAQLIMAQTQLMSQHLALMHSAGALTTAPIASPVASVAPPTPAPTTSAAPAHNKAAVVASSAFTTAASVKPVSEDRSSPLRALDAPITPTTGNLSSQQNTYLNALSDRYQKKTQKSKALVQASRKNLADSRASIGFRFSTKEILYPITGVESTGAHIHDIDGNRYIDLTMGFGVLLFGSKPDFLKGVIEEEASHGFQLGPRSVHMEEITKLFTELTGHDRVAFTNSGTEAVMIAMRLARATTGRDKIVIFEGAYNGHSDGTLVKTTTVNGEYVSEPVAPGVPRNIAKDVLVLEYGTPATLEVIRQHAHELAAVLVEPVQSRRLDFQPFDFLKQLRTLTEEKNVALIFDEMVSGFRAHPAGVQGLLGIKADIATYGKIIGGGLPIGAVAGSSRFLDGIDGGFWEYGDNSYPRATRTYFGGTFCQHPFSMATCLSTLRKLKAEGPALQANLNLRTAALAQTLNTFFESEQIPMKVIHFASTFQFKFNGNLEIFYYQLLEKGVYIWEWRACFLSTAHTDQDIDDLIRIIKESVLALRDGGFIAQTTTQVTTAATSVASTASTFTKVKEEPSQRAWFRNQSKLSHTETLPQVSKDFGFGVKSLGFGISYFGNYDPAQADDKYQLLMKGAQYADENGFSSVWIPERHFNQFGGFCPNPSVLAAALARETKRIQICAGSVVAPLHDPIRIVEEWSLVDNLSNGRVGVSFASGWHPNDFVFAPDSFSNNRNITFDTIHTVRQLWSGQAISRKGGNQSDVSLSTFPRPKQNQLPCWLTVVNNPDSYQKAGELGMSILTNLMGQSLEDLASNIRIYKTALARQGHEEGHGRITVLIHTYLEKDAARAIEVARKPMCDYLLSSIHLFQKMAESQGPVKDIDRASKEDKEFIVNKAYEKYVATSALIGSPKSVEPIVDHLLQIGVTELACFIDFGVDTGKVMGSLPLVSELKDTYNALLTNKSKTFPLGEAQKQLWLLAQLNPEGNLAYNDPAAISLKGPLKVDDLLAAIQASIHRHDSLRTWIDQAGATQHVQDRQTLELDRVDLSQAEDSADALRLWFLTQANRSRQLSASGLFKPYLIKLAEDSHILALQSHHIVTDGPSMGVVLHEIIQNYAQRVKGLPFLQKPALQYREFLRWQQGIAQSEATLTSEAYWLNQFVIDVPELELPCDFPRPAVKSYKGARAWAEINTALLKGIREFGVKNGSTIYMVMFTAFSILLHRLSNQNRIVIGAPYTGRSIEGSDSLVGYCVHLLPILSCISPDSTAASHLQLVRQSLLKAYEHQDYPFARMLDKLNLQRDISRAPLVNVIFNLERLDGPQTVEGLTVEMQPQPIAYTRMDLTLTANLKGDRISLECDYNVDLFRASSIDSILNSYLGILEAMIKDSSLKVSHIPLLSPQDSATQLTKWNPSNRKPEYDLFIQQWEQGVLLHPDTIALISQVQGNEVTLSYAELNAHANQLARHLLGMGLQLEQRVGICLTRSWQMIVAMLACLKAGGAYVPLDPSYPKTRLDFILDDAKIELLVTESVLLKRLSFSPEKTFCIDSNLEKVSIQKRTNLGITPRPQNLAYIIYTSGSSGKPKGAMITHEGLGNYLSWAKDAYQATKADGSPVLSSFSFDATITSIFVPLISDNKIVLLPEGQELEALHSLNRSPYQYSFIKITPAHLELLNSLRETDKFSRAHLTNALVLGGEALQGSSVKAWLESGHTSIVNEYGPTETVVGCCVFDTKKVVEGLVPIGTPIDGMRLYVLDADLQLLPAGLAGDLYIGGLGLARGYSDRPAQTALAFIPDPFCLEENNPGARLYRTGDRARYTPEGNLVFLGRKDKQIKLHGYRIELAEIEAVLAALPDMKDVAVMLREDSPGNQRLAAYFTSRTGDSSNIQQVRQSLLSQLPEYMVPTVLIQVSEMPLSAHGKIDLKALPSPKVDHVASPNGLKPSGTIPTLIAKVWCEALGCSQVSLTDNFFDIGGNSLLILQVFKQLESILPPHFLVVDLFKYPTIEALAEFISRESVTDTLGQGKVNERAAKQKAAILNKATRQKAGLAKTRLNKSIATN